MRVSVEQQADAIVQAYADEDGLSAEDQRALVQQKIGLSAKQVAVLGQVLGDNDIDGITRAEARLLARAGIAKKLIARLSGPDGTLALQQRSQWFARETDRRLSERDLYDRVDTKAAARWLERGIERGVVGVAIVTRAVRNGNDDWRRVALDVLKIHPELLQQAAQTTLVADVARCFHAKDISVQLAALRLVPTLPLDIAERDAIFIKILLDTAAAPDLHLQAISSWRECVPPTTRWDVVIRVSATYVLAEKVRGAAIQWIGQSGAPDVQSRALKAWTKKTSVEYDGVATLCAYLQFIQQHGTPGNSDAGAILGAVLASKDSFLQQQAMQILSAWGPAAHRWIDTLLPVVRDGRFAAVNQAMTTVDRIGCVSVGLQGAMAERLVTLTVKDIFGELTDEEHAIRLLLADHRTQNAECR